jgi:hypothetical protein
MDQEISKVFFYDVRCAVVMHYYIMPILEYADMLQFGTNSIIVLMFVESQRVHIQSTCKVCNKNLRALFYYIKKYICFYLRCIVCDKLLKPRNYFE